MAVNLFELLGTVAIDTSGANRSIDDVTDKAEKSEGKLSKVFEKIGSASVKVGKVMATGLAAGATAMAGLTSKALNLAGELEQNMGGSEAVYGKYAEQMQKKASKAYKNMGLSASDYLATANKMGALFKGAGFDAAEASELSAEAMQRAADVASIMGISVESAMESIAGAAKGNFTMMDNLGVAMNETNLEAYALSKGIEKAYSEMTQQEKIGLAMEMFLDKTSYATGNYAKENETLAGSLGTAKAALTNFLSGSGTASEVVESVLNAGHVVIENLNRLLPELVTGLNQLITELMPYLPALMESLLPGIIQGAVALLTGLVQALPGLLGIIIEQMPFIITQIGAALVEVFPVLLGTVKSLFGQIWDYISLELLNTGVSFEDALTKISEFFDNAWSGMQQIWAEYGQPIWDAISGAVDDVSGAFDEHMPAIMEKFSEMSELIQSVVNEYILPVVGDFIAMIQELWAENQDKLNLIGELFDAIFGWISEGVSKFVDDFKEKFLPFLESIRDFVKENMDRIKEIFQGSIDLISGIVQIFIALFKGDWEGMWEAIKNTAETWWNNICNIFSLAWDAIKAVWSASGASEYFASIWEGIKGAFGSVSSWFSDTFAAAWQKVKDIFTTGGEIFDGITEGIGNFFKTTVNGIIGGINKVIAIPFGKINDALSGIKSIEILGMKPFDWLSTIDVPEIPLLEQGGVLERGQVGLLEGNGAEAVVPLDQNEKWIHEVARDMGTATGNDALLQKILDVLLEIRNGVPEEFADIIASMKFAIGEREFARLVKAVN